MGNIIEVLKERGFIENMTSESLFEIAQNPLKVYAGFDPTADSLHVGNLVAIMGLAWFQRMGHTPVAIVGGATGMIGDPSGKSSERSLLSHEAIEGNLKGISGNLSNVLNFDHPTLKPIILNNYDWFSRFNFVEFLRDVGKHFRLGPMLAKESVRARLNSEEGMSFTEFSYQLLQGYDFLYLFDKYEVSVQIGGSDQWGNITAGSDLIRKVRSKTVYGITFPLLTRSDGKKFGKSEEGTIWLSADRLSPYEFYQYFVRVPDADVIKLMRILTFMDMDEIRFYELSMLKENYSPNSCQKRLAEEVTRIVHGEKGLEIAIRVTEGVRPGNKTLLNAEVLEKLSEDMPNVSFPLNEVLGEKFIDVGVKSGLFQSKGEGRRLIRNGGAYLNNKRVENEELSFKREDLIEGRLLLLAAGKKKKILLHILLKEGG